MLQLSKIAMRGRRPAVAVKPLLNLGCGHRRHPDWTNADLAPSAADVLAVDLRRPLPFAAASFTAVYASHVLEHLVPVEADRLLREARRVLAPGGILRIVVPDLEGIARGYLASIDAAAGGGEEARWRHRWMIVELLDQLVRGRSGGVMRRWWSCDPIPCRTLIESRLGAEATAAMTALANARARDGTPPAAPEAILMAEPVATGAAVRFAGRGERHQWMYDRVSLADLLTATGFTAARRVGPVESAIPGFSAYELDADAQARPHKPDSLFMEAVRP